MLELESVRMQFPADANIIIGLVINEELGDTIKITAIATGFGASFERGQRSSEDLKARAAAMASTKVDRDLPTFIRERQRDVPRSLRGSVEGDQEYDIPTFLRKRVD